MTPSIEIRLTSVIHGLRDVVFPALDPQESLAQEQSGLILAQLEMLLKQLPYANSYHRLCLDDLKETAEAMLRKPAGGAETMEARSRLGQILSERTNNPHHDYQHIGAGIDVLVRAVARDGEAAYRARVDEAAFAFGKRQNWRERAWFRDAGFDPDPAGLPEIADMCGASEA
jgi:hypothetical protein